MRTRSGTSVRFLAWGAAVLTGLGAACYLIAHSTPASLPSAIPAGAKSRSTVGLSAASSQAGAAARGSEADSAAFLRRLGAGLAAIDRLSDPLERAAEMESLTSGIAVGKIPAAMEFLRDGPDSGTARDSRLRLIQRWTGTDAPAAADWVREYSAEPHRQAEINCVAIAWAGRSRAEALAWVRTLTSEAERSGGMLGIAYETARTEPMEAFGVAGELPDNALRDELITHTANQWTDRNAREALDWAGRVEDETLRLQLLTGITTAWAAREPAEAATAAVELLPPGRQLDDAVMGIVQQWVQTEPLAAAGWVAAFPSGALRDTALGEVVKLWTDQDNAKAGEWIRELDAAQRDPALAAYAGKLALFSPRTALEWAGMIREDALRQQTLESTAASWIASDPRAAELWIASAAITGEARDRLLAPLQQ